MMRVQLLGERGADGRPHGCAYIRLLLPLARLAEAGRITLNPLPVYAPCDVLCVDRTLHPWMDGDQALDTVRRAHIDGCRVLYSIDDNLLDLDAYQVYRRAFSEDQLHAVRTFLRHADAVLTTTPTLAERLSRLNPRVTVAPNMLDDRLLVSEDERPPKTADRLVLGYMGTFTHEDDLMLILQPLRRFLSERADRVVFERVGASAEAPLFQALKDLPVHVRDIQGVSEYPDFMRWMGRNLAWDIGLAPLVNNPFTRCKSDIKFLDYAAIGAVGLFSDVEAYRHTVRDGVNGRLVPNDPDAWYRALCAIADDHEGRRRMATAANEYLLRERTLNTQAGRWEAALNAALA